MNPRRTIVTDVTRCIKSVDATTNATRNVTKTRNANQVVSVRKATFEKGASANTNPFVSMKMMMITTTTIRMRGAPRMRSGATLAERVTMSVLQPQFRVIARRAVSVSTVMRALTESVVHARSALRNQRTSVQGTKFGPLVRVAMNVTKTNVFSTSDAHPDVLAKTDTSEEAMASVAQKVNVQALGSVKTDPMKSLRLAANLARKSVIKIAIARTSDANAVVIARTDTIASMESANERTGVRKIVRRKRNTRVVRHVTIRA